MAEGATGDELVGKTLGECRLERVLARGGMSVTFEGRHKLLDVPVVLKLLDPRRAWGKPELTAAFLSEARALGAITHPHVVRVISAGAQDDLSFLVLEHVGGGTLRARLRDGELEVDEVVELLAQAGEGLGAAHAQGIVHGDVKPENLLLDGEGGLKVVDFGLAKTAGFNDVGALYGTPAYLAPERWRGQAPQPSDDVYALGVTLYECLTDQWPFNAPEPRLLGKKHLEEAPPREPLEESVERPLVEFTLACLSKAPRARLADGAAFAAGLRAAAARQEPPAKRRPKRARRARRSSASARRVSSGRHPVSLARRGRDGGSNNALLVAAFFALVGVVVFLMLVTSK